MEAARATALRSHLDRCPECTELVAEFARVFASQSIAPRASDTPSSDGASATQQLPARYELLGVVGSGGMGVVVRAYDRELLRNVAIKVLRSESSANSPKRFAREARAMAQLSHPNVVEILDARVSGSHGFIVMELVEGTTLRAWAQRDHSWRRIVEVYTAAGRGLAAAHALGLIHRDFKPDNVLIEGDAARVLVTDFGLVGTASDVTSQLERIEVSGHDSSSTPSTMTGTVLGTPRYMAPEVRAGRRADARSDQYSFCVALNEALAGRKVPTDVRKTLQRGLATEPELRFGEIGDLLAALHRGLRLPPGRAVALGGMGIVAIAALGVMNGDRPATASATATACVANSPVAAAWSDAARVEIGEAFARDASGHTRAVVERLDDYALRFERAWSEDCSRACLHVAASAHGALVNALLDGDQSVFVNARVAIAELPSPNCNADDAASLSRSAESQAHYEELGAASTFREVGLYDRASAAAQAVLAAAEVDGDARLRVKALIELGTNEIIQSRFADARRTIGAAMAIAEAEAFEADASAAAISLLHIAAITGDFDEAHRIDRHADAMLTRWGASNRHLAGFEAARALLANSERRVDDWVEHAERRVTLLESAEGIPGIDLAAALANRGSARGTAGDAIAALADLDRACELGSAEAGAEHPQVASFRATRAKMLELAGRYEEALAETEALVALDQQRVSAGGKASIQLQANLASLLYLTGQQREAVELGRHVLTLADERNGDDDPEMPGYLANLASYLEYFEELAEADIHLRRALRILERKLGPGHPHLGWFEVTLGWHAVRQGHVDAGMQQMRGALAAMESAPNHRRMNVAYALLRIGASERDIGQADRSVATLERAATLFQAVTTDPTQLAELRFELAQSLVNAGIDQPRARGLAKTAREALLGNAGATREVERIDAWLHELEQAVGSP